MFWVEVLQTTGADGVGRYGPIHLATSSEINDLEM
jgi:hypothetical protein